MNRQEYSAYLNSPYWNEFRKKILKFWRGKCCICNSKRGLSVHHRTYVRTPFKEHIEDCIALCGDCHRLFHGVLPKPTDAKIY